VEGWKEKKKKWGKRKHESRNGIYQQIKNWNGKWKINPTWKKKARKGISSKNARGKWKKQEKTKRGRRKLKTARS